MKRSAIFFASVKATVLSGVFTLCCASSVLAAQSGEELYSQAEELRLSATTDDVLREALALHLQAVDQGKNASHYRIGLINLELGKHKAALDAFNLASELGSGSARTMAAVTHANGGFGELSDPSLGVPVLREMARLESGQRAAFELARLYETGVGVETDPVRAVSMYQDLAERGNARAQRQLGRLYLKGADKAELAQSVEKAVALLRRAVENGSDSAKRDLGLALIETRDFSGAKTALEDAAANGIAGATADLANAHYRNLLGPLSNETQGRSDLKTLAEAGDIYAIRHALVHYERRSRRIEDLDVDKVVNHLWGATEKGNGAAARALARYYRKLGWMMTDEKRHMKRLTSEFGDVLGEEALVAENVTLLYDRDNHRASQRKVIEYLESLDTPGFANGLLRLRAIEPQAYVRILQRELKRHGFYRGYETGMATRSTILAILRFCKEEAIYDTCIHGPTMFESARLISEALEELR